VCLDAFGKRLITDPGTVQYPSDFFGPERYQYYNASVWGHNVPVFGGREMRTGVGYAAEVLAFAAEDVVGAAWAADTTVLYGGVNRVRRGVVHLLPWVVAVLDAADLRTAETTSLRWHTVDRAEPDTQGNFTVRNADASVVAKVVAANHVSIEFRRGEHCYHAPFDRDRLGNLLEQKHESYVETVVRAETVRLLSLFAVGAPGQDAPEWSLSEDGTWCVTTADGVVRIECDGLSMRVDGPSGILSLNVDQGVTGLTG